MFVISSKWKTKKLKKNENDYFLLYAPLANFPIVFSPDISNIVVIGLWPSSVYTTGTRRAAGSLEVICETKIHIFTNYIIQNTSFGEKGRAAAERAVFVERFPGAKNNHARHKKIYLLCSCVCAYRRPQ